MKLRLTVVATALSVLTISPVFADGGGACDYASKFKYTSVEPQDQSEAAKKLAKLSQPVGEQEKVASALAEASASPSQGAEITSAQ